MFRTVSQPIIRSFSLYTQHWYMSYRFADTLRAVCKPVWHIPLLCLQWKTPDDVQRNCLKHVEFYPKNKFEKLVLLVGFITGIYHDAWSPECHTYYMMIKPICLLKLESFLFIPKYSVIKSDLYCYITIC